jgi:tetratricopeptide (TPR) repeat protein
LAVGYGLVGLIGLGFAVRTVTRVPDWATPASLEASSIKVSYNSARSNQYYAYSLYVASQTETDPVKQKALYDEAWPYVNKALEIYPAYSDALTCRAGIAAGYYLQDDDIKKLLQCFEDTQRMRPTEYVDQFMDYLTKVGKHPAELIDWIHRVGFGYFWIAKKNPDMADKYLKMGLRMAPEDPLLNSELVTIQQSPLNRHR